MTDFGYYQDRIAAQQIQERIARRQASRMPSPHKPRGRRALADRLHHLADRLDG
jgi:hypothetical protein